MFFQKKGQSSIEFLLIIGVAFTMLVPSMFFFSKYMDKSSEGIAGNQINQIGNELINVIETMYYYGKDAKTVYRVSFPEGVSGLKITERTTFASCSPVPPGESCISELEINLSTNYGNLSYVFPTFVNVTDMNLLDIYTMDELVARGKKEFNITSHGNYVNVTVR